MRRIAKWPLLLLALSVSLWQPPALRAGSVTDQLGRRVNVPDAPQRIIALAPSITEIIYALGEERRLRGVTQFSDYPEAALALPQVGSYVNLDLEKIVALRPDLCIAVKDGNPKAVIDKLEALHIPVYAVDPRDLESVMEAISAIGRLLGAGEHADRIIARMAKRVEKVKATVAKARHYPKVFFQIGITPIVSIGSGTFIHELIVMAGGRNLAQGKVPYPRFSKEQVLSLAPEIFIITSMDRDGLFEQIQAEWQKWPDMPAVKNNRILLVDSNLLDRAGPRLVDGLELLARLIHPELFPEALGEKQP